MLKKLHSIWSLRFSLVHGQPFVICKKTTIGKNDKFLHSDSQWFFSRNYLLRAISYVHMHFRS